jgi:dephospho-CoA kinase
MKLIGITGGIGSGKSTVGDMLAGLGYTVIDSDRVAHELTSPGSKVLAEIVEHFGTEVLHPDGGLDRKKLGSIVFSDPSRRKELESILHPRIVAECLDRAGKADREPEGREPVFILAPLLFEAGLEDLFDSIWLCYAPDEIRIDRVMKRDQVERESVIRRMRAQVSDESKREKVDIIINTGGSIDEMESNVLKALESL